MKLVAIALLLCNFGSIEAAAVRKDHPISKVIDLLEGLKLKAIAQGKKEEVSYGKFQYWCSTSIADLKDAIAEEKEKIEELQDKIAGLEKKKASLEEDIKSLEEQIAKLEAAAKKAKEIRDDEAALYKKAHKDLEDTIDAVEQCIKALEKAEVETEAPAPAFAQKKVRALLTLLALKTTTNTRKVIQKLRAFAEPEADAEVALKDRPEQLAKGDLEAHTDKYDFKSENVIELLKQLKLKFQDDSLAGTKAETNAINAYELAKEARDNAIDAATKSKEEKEKLLADTEAAIADAEAELKSTQEDLAADSKSLKETTNACNVKASEWEERSKTRELEIEAMDMAMKILSKSTGVRNEVPGNPVPPPNPVAAETDFLQLMKTSTSDDPKMKAVVLIRQTAKEQNSKALERLAVEIAAHLKGPFDAVNNMIEKMIFRLMDEQKVEDEHKNWCDKEIAKTNEMIDNKEQKIAELSDEIKVQTGKVAVLTDEIAEAEDMIAKIKTFMGEATEVRQVGKKENEEAIKDSKQAQDSVTNAIAVLEAFYKESGEIPKEPWEFVQAPVELPENPATWDSGYTAVADPSKQPGGIITVLENVLSDFEKMESETKANEAEDQKEYEEAMSANEQEKAGREQEVEMKTNEKKRRVEKIASLSSQKKNVEGELEKTEQYMKDLHPACIDGDSTYDDRKAARAKEVEALQKAQVILEDAFKEKPEEEKSFVQKKYLRSQHKIAA